MLFFFFFNKLKKENKIPTVFERHLQFVLLLLFNSNKKKYIYLKKCPLWLFQFLTPTKLLRMFQQKQSYRVELNLEREGVFENILLSLQFPVENVDKKVIKTIAKQSSYREVLFCPSWVFSWGSPQQLQE